MTLRAIHNHRNFFSDYWLGTLLSARGAAGPRLSAADLRRRMRRLTRLVDGLGGSDRVEPARFRERFARPLLRDVLDFELGGADVDALLHPLRPAGAAPDSAPVAIARFCNDALDLDRPAVRREIETALASAGLGHGLILTPTILRLVRRAGDGPRLAALDVALDTLRELEDDASLQAAYRLLSAGSFVAGPNHRRPIDVLEAESREHSAKVSVELKSAVFQAAERIVGAFQRDVASRPTAFADAAPSTTEIRDAGFLALYRLLFILYAEARDERLADHRLYRESYGLDRLITTLIATQPDQVPANRTRIWSRLTVLFRVFNEGLRPNLPDLENIPPRGGRLFSDSTAEGTLLKRLQVDDRTARDILLAITTTRPRRGVGRERVSFRELEIEQLGAVYEGLLEYEPAVAEELRLVVRLGSREAVLTPRELVELCQYKRLVVTGDPELVEGTPAATLHPAHVQDDAADEGEDAGDDEESDNSDDEGGDDDGETAVRAGQPVRLLRRIPPGTLYFRRGGARKSTGSYYTPTPMVDFLVREALGPLTIDRSAQEIEQLRVVDLACGSAHFLVGAARFLGARLLQAYRAELGDDPPAAFSPGAGDRAAVRSRWLAEAEAWCKRRIVERCLYGVDLNPAAVQLAQVALWIESLAGDRPLSFFAHHIRVGNSLLGTFTDRFDSPPDPNLAARGDRATLGLFESRIRQRIETALGERRLIDAELPPEIRVDTPEEFQYKEDRLRRSEAALADARLLMDMRSAAPFLPPIWADLPTLSGASDPQAAARARPWWDTFERVRAREQFFHWELEFPEVLLRDERPGFDAVLGNPPWDKVLPSKKEFYADVDPLVVVFKGNELDQRIRRLHRTIPDLEERFESERERTTTLARVLRQGGDFPLARPSLEDDQEGQGRRQRRRGGTSAHEDLSKYFVDRSIRLARQGGAIGLVVPSVVYNGDGCVGIRQHLLRQANLQAFYGFENRRRIFPIHASYRFANVAARMSPDGSGGFDAAFMRHDVTELASSSPKPWQVRITHDELEQLSPDTLAFLEYRGPRDQEIVRRMSARRPAFGGSGVGSWGTRLISWRRHEIIYNSTTDRDLFSSASTQRPTTVESVLGPQAPKVLEDQIKAMQAAGYRPVFGGEQVHAYLLGLKPLSRWLSVHAATIKYGDRARSAETLVFRDQARSTDERSCIAAILPPESAATYTLVAAVFESVPNDAASVVLNSFAFDYLLRFRLAGMHLSGTYILPVAVPPAGVVNTLPRLHTRFAPAAGIKHVSEDRDSWPALWAADRAVAEAYGLGAEDFAHILETFPVWLRKRAALAAYYRARLAEWLHESGNAPNSG